MLSLSFTRFHFFSIIIACVVQGLAVVNFGVLSIWVNSTAASLALIYHVTILILNRRRRRTTISNSPVNITKNTQSNNFPRDLKLPGLYPSTTYAPQPPPLSLPPYGSEKPEPNRRPVTIIVVPPPAGNNNNNNTVTESPTDDNNTSKSPPPSGAFYTLTSLSSLIGITIITMMGFGMTVEVSIHGSKSLLPAERAKGMTFPWNMKIQKAQCTFLGVQLLLCLIAVLLCKWGRDEVERVEEEEREEREYYGFESSSPRVSVFFFSLLLGLMEVYVFFL